MDCSNRGRPPGFPGDGIIMNALPADPPTAKALRNAGWSVKRIAEELHIEEEDVKILLTGNRIKYITRSGRRITQRSIRLSMADGLTDTELSTKYHIPISRVAELKRFAERKESKE